MRRILRQTSIPSIPGSMTSRTAISGRRARMHSSPSSPVVLAVTLCPWRERANSTDARMSGSSSTNTMLAMTALFRS